MNDTLDNKSIEEKQTEFKNATITVTESAVKRLVAVMKSDGKDDHFLRMSVEGGGCSGMTYKMDFENEKRDYDKEFESNGLTIVCDLKSWPGGKGVGDGSDADWALAHDVYGFADDAEAMAYPHNPVDSLTKLAANSVPLLHVYGDADTTVPWEENMKKSHFGKF